MKTVSLRRNLLLSEGKVIQFEHKLQRECSSVTDGGNALILFNDIKCQYDAIGCTLDCFITAHVKFLSYITVIYYYVVLMKQVLFILPPPSKDESSWLHHCKIETLLCVLPTLM